MESPNRPLYISVRLCELLDPGFERGYRTRQLDDLGVGASTTTAIRGRRSSGGGSRPWLGNLDCGLVESQCV